MGELCVGNHAAALGLVAGTYDQSPPDIDQIMAGFTRTPLGEDRAWWLGYANMCSSDPIAADLYFSSIAWDDSSWPRIKEWGYRVAVEFVGARKSEQRKRSLVESYRVDWGHQAARDGLGLAMWGPTDIPGSRSRALDFKCGQQAYRRVRDEVSAQAASLIAEYRYYLDMARVGNYSGEAIRRWEIATGAKWCKTP